MKIRDLAQGSIKHQLKNSVAACQFSKQNLDAKKRTSPTKRFSLKRTFTADYQLNVQNTLARANENLKNGKLEDEVESQFETDDNLSDGS